MKRLLAALTLPEPLITAIAPPLVAMETLNAQMNAAAARLAQRAAHDPVVRRLAVSSSASTSSIVAGIKSSRSVFIQRICRKWWRRRESNPRPKASPQVVLQACPAD